MTINELIEATGMSITDFALYFNIPYRTVTAWMKQKYKCAPYLLELIEYKLRHEGLIL